MNVRIMPVFRNVLVGSLAIFLLTGCLTSPAREAGKKAYFNYDYSAAMAEFQKAATEGDAEAQWWLSRMYAHGDGIEEDQGEALKWLRMSAESGYSRAQMDLGLRYLAGFTVDKDEAEAAKWIGLAADQKDPMGLVTMGFLYAQGKGVERDEAKARDYYIKAKELGFPVPSEMTAGD